MRAKNNLPVDHRPLSTLTRPHTPIHTEMTNSETTTPPQAPTPNESDVYDRQIRLWGAEAQVKFFSHHF